MIQVSFQRNGTSPRNTEKEILWTLFKIKPKYSEVTQQEPMLGPMVCTNPITVICPITPTLKEPITKMEVAHTMGLGKQDTTGQDEACYPSFGQKKVKKKFSSPFQQWDI